MKITDERKQEKVCFQDLMVGDVFYEINPEDGQTKLLMVTPTVRDDDDDDEYNCVCLETGWGWLVADDDLVEKVNARIVLY